MLTLVVESLGETAEGFSFARAHERGSDKEMGSTEEGGQMMTEKCDKLIEALMPEEQQDVNAVLARIELLDPRLKYAIVSYFSLEPGGRDPNLIDVWGSIPIDEADKKILGEVVCHVSVTMHGEQRYVVCREINKQLDEGSFIYQADGPKQNVRI
jgi:hypothetical protein